MTDRGDVHTSTQAISLKRAVMASIKSHRTACASLLSILLFACVTAKPFSAADVEGMYANRDEKELQRAVSDPHHFEDANAMALAKARLDLLKRQRINDEANTAIAEKEEGLLERIVAGEFDGWLDPQIKAKASAALVDSKRQKIQAKVEMLAREGNMVGLGAMQADPAVVADPKLLYLAKRYLFAYSTPDPKLVVYRGIDIERSVRELPPKLGAETLLDPEQALPPLVASLTKGLLDPFRKAKALHDWISITIGYDTEEYFHNVGHAQDYASVLRRRTAVCAGYSALFSEMAKLAGFEVRIIEGHSKGFGYAGKVGSRPDHAWNQICINSIWYSVDCTWDSGFVDYATFHRRYSTQYLFIEPRALAYSHLAVPDSRQLLASPLGSSQFEAEPLIEGEFFRLDSNSRKRCLSFRRSRRKSRSS
jgi:hypothetical protein